MKTIRRCFSRHPVLVFLLTAISATTLTSLPAQAKEFFPLVDGKRQAVLVGQSLFLRQAVERCTGVKLKVIPEKDYHPQPEDYPVYLGQSRKAQELLSREISALDSEGYIFLIQPSLAIIYAGPARTDTGEPQLWAEANFCRDYFGVDQYFPGELGQEYPRLEKILIPCELRIENPVFKHRHWSGYCGKAGPAWRVRASGGGGRFQFHHNLWRIIDPAKYAQHPEYFPVIPEETRKHLPLYQKIKSGERFVPPPGQNTSWQPCVSHPEVLSLTVETITHFFDEHPQANSFSLGINDGGGFCQCAECLKIFPEGLPPSSRQANAYRMYRFYQQVAEQVAVKHPGVRLGFLAYSDLNTWYPEKLHPLLMPYLTQSFADAFDPVYREKNYASIKKVSSFATHSGLYEYLYGEGFLIPRLYLRQLAEGLRYAADCGADGFYAEAYPNWGLDGPKLYVLEKLLWQPHQEVETLVSQWCQGLFGEVAPLMKDYFDFLERAWCQQKPSSASRGMYRLLGFRYKKEQLTEIFPPEICEQAWQKLLAAEKVASQLHLPDRVRRRITYFQESFGATRLASQRFHTAARMKAMLEQENKEKKELPLEDWILALNEWARLSNLNSYMARLKVSAPGSFQAFCQEKTTGSQPYAWSEWDSEPLVLRHLVDRFLHQATRERKFASRQELTDYLLNRLQTVGQNLNLKGTPCQQAVVLLKPLLASLSLDAAMLSVEPVLDGEIEPAWGQPQFSGKFYLYAHPGEEVINKTTENHYSKIKFPACFVSMNPHHHILFDQIKAGTLCFQTHIFSPQIFFFLGWPFKEVKGIANSKSQPF